MSGCGVELLEFKLLGDDKDKLRNSNPRLVEGRLKEMVDMEVRLKEAQCLDWRVR